MEKEGRGKQTQTTETRRARRKRTGKETTWRKVHGGSRAKPGANQTVQHQRKELGRSETGQKTNRRGERGTPERSDTAHGSTGRTSKATRQRKGAYCLREQVRVSKGTRRQNIHTSGGRTCTGRKHRKPKEAERGKRHRCVGGRAERGGAKKSRTRGKKKPGRYHDQEGAQEKRIQTKEKRKTHGPQKKECGKDVYTPKSGSAAGTIRPRRRQQSKQKKDRRRDKREGIKHVRTGAGPKQED